MRSMIGLTVLAILFTCAERLPAQAEPEAVKFTTKDGVDLRGQFYAGKSEAPVVMFLHNVGDKKEAGGNCRTKPWVDLAQALQKGGFAVLAFDFRGHGHSTQVDPDKFWSPLFAYNRKFVRAGANPRTIEYKSFDPNYLPVLANDIAAAKGFLDRRNDKGDCNSSNVILIGAQTGATLGAVWLRSEYYRHKFTPANILQRIPARIDPKHQGNDVIGCVWLTINPKLGNWPAKLTTVLDMPVRKQAVPTAFMYSDQDKNGKAVARYLEKHLVPAKKGQRFEYTAAFGVKDTNLKGADMLQVPGAATIIQQYAKKIVENKGSEWLKKEYTESQYIWNLGGTPVMLKVPDDLNLRYDTYTRFLR